MQQFTIKDIENLTGIKAHTLRIWEQRYPALIEPHLKNKHRVYKLDYLKKLLRISFLYHKGFKISSIAALSEQEIVKIIQNTFTEAVDYKLYILQLIEAAINFDEVLFSGTLNTVIKTAGFEKCITEVCYPFLTRIGMLWVTNKVIPAQEHFASYIIQNKIIAAINELPLSSEGATIVLFSPKGEYHELPLLFLHYLLKKNGWNTIYMGVNVKWETLQQFKLNAAIQYFYLHIITNFTGFLLDDYFENLCRQYSTVQIVASGAGIHYIQRHFTNLQLLSSDKAIYEFVQANSRPHLQAKKDT